MDPKNDEEISTESLENQIGETSDNDSDEENLAESFIQVKGDEDEFELIYNQIEKAFTKNNNEKELKYIIRNSSFLILGAAGSIGQALSKEIFFRRPKKLHVVDIS